MIVLLKWDILVMIDKFTRKKMVKLLQQKWSLDSVSTELKLYLICLSLQFCTPVQLRNIYKTIYNILYYVQLYKRT
jgi:hypothetical protein